MQLNVGEKDEGQLPLPNNKWKRESSHMYWIMNAAERLECAHTFTGVFSHYLMTKKISLSLLFTITNADQNYSTLKALKLHQCDE